MFVVSNGLLFSASYGTIRWDNNYITLLDGMLQFYAFQNQANVFQVPTKLRRISIWPFMETTGIRNLTIKRYKNYVVFLQNVWKNLQKIFKLNDIVHYDNHATTFKFFKSMLLLNNEITLSSEMFTLG